MGSDSPRILLFGHPGSGKSSLLGALQRAGDTQGETLGYEVLDPTGRLPRIRDHLYDGSSFERTNTELVSHELRLKPWRVGERPAGSVQILDCDGNAANALLKHPDPITERAVHGLVASAVVQADLIALVVNAAAADEDLDDAFDEFVMFLERVHGRKAFEREVGGFPIELILTQCDLLFEPGDTRERWLEETDQRLNRVLKRFAEFIREHRCEGEGGYFPFGGIRLNGHAVAVREPGGSEPFRVAECFRDLFARAREQRARVWQSQRHLRRMLWTVAAAVWLLFAGAVAVSLYQPQPADPGLADRVRAYWDREPPAAERLAGRNLARNRRHLAEFQSDPGYFALPDDLRGFVGGRLNEADEYQAYLAKLDATPAPAEARSLEELARIESSLNGELNLPAHYTWGETEAAKRRDRWLADIPPIRAAEAAAQEWYRGLVNQALALTHTRSFEGEWRDRVAALEAAGARMPFDGSATLPGAADVTYRTALEFDRVYQAARDWDFNRTRLLQLRDLVDALGLTAELAKRPLDIPPPGTAVDPAERLKALPNDKPLSLLSFPDPARSALAIRVRESLANGTKHARKLIGESLTADAPEAWRALADRLAEPAIRDWGRLLHVLMRLDDAQAVDPIWTLNAFLKSTEFTFDVKGFDLLVPLALRVPPLVPAGRLAVTVTPKNGEPIVRGFKLTGESEVDGANAVYRLVPETPGPFAFQPGDGLKVELAARSGDQRLLLTWDDSANRTFPFDRFAREPKLLPATGAAEAATGVRLVPIPGSQFPRLPILLPDAKKN